jgi:hypothetical protein
LLYEVSGGALEVYTYETSFIGTNFTWKKPVFSYAYYY